MKKIETHKEKGEGPATFGSWLAGNWIVVTVCLVAVLICMVAYLNAAIITEKVNAHWSLAWEESCKPNGFLGGTPEQPDPYIWNGSKLPVLDPASWQEATP